MPRLNNRAGLAAGCLFLLRDPGNSLRGNSGRRGSFYRPPFFPTLTITYVFRSCLTTFR